MSLATLPGFHRAPAPAASACLRPVMRPGHCRHREVQRCWASRTRCSLLVHRFGRIKKRDSELVKLGAEWDGARRAGAPRLEASRRQSDQLPAVRGHGSDANGHGSVRDKRTSALWSSGGCLLQSCLRRAPLPAVNRDAKRPRPVDDRTGPFAAIRTGDHHETGRRASPRKKCPSLSGDVGSTLSGKPAIAQIRPGN